MSDKLTLAREPVSKKPKMLTPGTPYWHHLAYQELLSYASVHSCRECGGPVISGYSCRRCGSSRP